MKSYWYPFMCIITWARTPICVTSCYLLLRNIPRRYTECRELERVCRCAIPWTASMAYRPSAVASRMHMHMHTRIHMLIARAVTCTSPYRPPQSLSLYTCQYTYVHGASIEGQQIDSGNVQYWLSYKSIIIISSIRHFEFNHLISFRRSIVSQIRIWTPLK